MRRPTFIATAATALGALSVGRAVKAGEMTTATTDIPKRRLGRTNAQVSIVGMGGFHLGKPDLPDGDAIKLIHSGLDRGITFLDNSWDYNNGNSELRVGRALQLPGYRAKAFLMTKIDGRTKEAFNKQFDESLHRLLVDHATSCNSMKTFGPTMPTGSSRGRRTRGGDRRAAGRQDALHRFYRPQKPRLSSPHDRACR